MNCPNRVVVSPIARYSAVNRTPNDWHFSHYAERAEGGAGCRVTHRMTCVATRRITPGCRGLCEQARRSVEEAPGRFRSSSYQCPRSQCKLDTRGARDRTQVGWVKWTGRSINKTANPTGRWSLLVGYSVSGPHRSGTHAATHNDMIDTSRKALTTPPSSPMTRIRSARAAYGTGYLLGEFSVTDHDQRSDEYGRQLANRLRFPSSCFAPSTRCGRDRADVGACFSSELDAGGTPVLTACKIAQAFKDAGCDLFDVSTGQIYLSSKPVYGRMFQASFSEQIRLEVGIATMAVGAVTTAESVPARHPVSRPGRAGRSVGVRPRARAAQSRPGRGAAAPRARSPWPPAGPRARRRAGSAARCRAPRPGARTCTGGTVRSGGAVRPPK